MLNKDELKVGDSIEYLGENWIAFSGTYKIYHINDSYLHIDDVPMNMKDELIIFVESGDSFIEYPVSFLKENEWRKVDESV